MNNRVIEGSNEQERARKVSLNLMALQRKTNEEVPQMVTVESKIERDKMR